MKQRTFSLTLVLLLFSSILLGAGPVRCECQRGTGLNENGQNTQDTYAYTAEDDCCLGAALSGVVHSQVEVYPGTWQTVSSNFNMSPSDVQKECCPDI